MVLSCPSCPIGNAVHIAVFRIEIHDSVPGLQCAFLPTMKIYMPQKVSG